MPFLLATEHDAIAFYSQLRREAAKLSSYPCYEFPLSMAFSAFCCPVFSFLGELKNIKKAFFIKL
jgi:hypothetical protein